jgi:hypothetical protein
VEERPTPAKSRASWPSLNWPGLGSTCGGTAPPEFLRLLKREFLTHLGAPALGALPALPCERRQAYHCVAMAHGRTECATKVTVHGRGCMDVHDANTARAD